MPAFQINDDEWGALFDAPHHLLKVYASIRMHMDYQTGITGLSRRISEQMLREVLSNPASPGRPAHQATRKEVRYSLETLTKLGLLDPMPSLGPFVFALPQASYDQSVSERWGQRLAPGGARGGAKEILQEHSNDAASSEIDGEGGALGFPQVGPEVGPTSGLPPNLPTSSSSRTSADDRFAMHDGWEPSARGWKATAMRNGLGNTTVHPDQLLEFRSYWINRPDKFQSQGQWEHELAQKIIRGNRHAQSNPGRTAQAETAQNGAARGQPGRGRKLSAPDEVRAAIERGRLERATACGAAAHGAAGTTLDHDGGDLRPPLDGEFWRDSEA